MNVVEFNYIIEHYAVGAVRVTAENIESVAEWCKGNIKGVKLPHEEWVIDLKGEQRAEIGDFIMTCNLKEFAVVPASFFE